MQILLLMYKTGLIFSVPPPEIPRWFSKNRSLTLYDDTNVATPYSDLNLILSFHTDIHRVHGLDRLCSSASICMCVLQKEAFDGVWLMIT